MRTKAQDHSNAAKAKKAQQASTQLANKFTALILMDVDLRKIGRKNLGLHSKRMKVDPMNQEGPSEKQRRLLQQGLCTVCFMRKTLTIGQGIALSSSNLKRRWHKNQPNLRHQTQ
jgi:hypothetical protein